MRNCKENVQLRVRNSQTAAARALALALAHGSARLGSSTRHAAPHDAHDAHAVARVAHHAVLRDVRLSFAFGTNVSGTRAARPCTRSMFPYIWSHASARAGAGCIALPVRAQATMGAGVEKAHAMRPCRATGLGTTNK